MRRAAFGNVKYPSTIAQMIKGKGKEREVHPAVSTALEEALTTPLSSSIDSTYASSPISLPPRAHYATPIRPLPPRLLSQLARSTMPTAGLSYASAGKRRAVSEGDPSRGESSTAWRSASPVEMDEPFPDLDPDSGLPQRRKDSTDSDAPSLHLQRTITDLLAAQPDKQNTSFLPFSVPGLNLPSLPSMPSIPSLPSMPNLPSINLPGHSALDGTGAKRSISTTSPKDDWGSWATGWWSGHKTKVDETLSKEDQADTVEEEQEKHRRKCELSSRPFD